MLINELKEMTDYRGNASQHYYKNCGITAITCTAYSFTIAPRIFIDKQFESGEQLNLQELIDHGLIIAVQNCYSFWEVNCDSFINLFELLCRTKMRDDIRHEIALDIFAYRENSLKQYKNNLIKATSISCAKKFLAQYSTAINVFKLNNEFSCKSSFNRFISNAYKYLNEFEEKLNRPINESKIL